MTRSFNLLGIARHRRKAQGLELPPSVSQMQGDLQGQRGSGRGFNMARCIPLPLRNPALTNT